MGFREKYEKLAHAIQSAIALAMNYDTSFVSPKNLRVGIDLTKSDQGALQELLIKKGIITEEELERELINGLQRELDFQTQQARKRFGNVNLNFE